MYSLYLMQKVVEKGLLVAIQKFKVLRLVNAGISLELCSFNKC